MVDNINFPKIVSPLSAAGRVNKVNQKKHQKEKSPFEKFLDQKGERDEKKKEEKKVSKKNKVSNSSEKKMLNNSTEITNTNAPAVDEGSSPKKIIDVRV